MLENTCRILVGKFKARDHLEDQDAGGILILKYGRTRAWIDVVESCCEDCNEPSGSI
jgi:hypothetical protein